MATVSEIMRHSLPLLTPGMSISEALDRMLESGLSGLPVVDSQRHIIGFLSEQDCIPKLINASYHCDNRLLVSDLMRHDPLTATLDTDVFELARLMGGPKPKLYPVVDGKKVIGIVTRHQVMSFLNNQLKTCLATY
ncbi:CBS domain-containing protein [Oceanimonas sp. CHS3-5]|uniref:CBS domain-containing protein n=1 Tax=Oceanimonas sp. CHS3-5 TaxID=3068186 RepID=UPI00273D5731|nr:CBS domain-containing protein [Oceanimonas sp. CHS3-5]MDP5293658.1 CBS domain-containing protein [Oceanimonas sp. CHS3-5]